MVLRPYTRAFLSKASATSGDHRVITAFWVSSSSIANFRLVLPQMSCLWNVYLVLLSAVS